MSNFACGSQRRTTPGRTAIDARSRAATAGSAEQQAGAHLAVGQQVHAQPSTVPISIGCFRRARMWVFMLAAAISTSAIGTSRRAACIAPTLGSNQRGSAGAGP
jgi:hypothetical protein